MTSEEDGLTAECIYYLYCGNRVDPATAYHYEGGWARPREKGGTNHLVDRHVFPDKFCCYACITKLKAGVNPKQGVLV